MTVVELHDASALQDLSSALSFSADVVYVVGSNEKSITNRKRILEKILRKRGYNSEIRCLVISKYGITQAVDRLCEIAREDTEVIFDVSGGSDYLLAAAGIAFERCNDQKPHLVHCSIRSGKTVFVENGKVISTKAQNAQLTCDEIIELHGGKIVYEDHKKNGTVIWDFTYDNFSKDVWKLWDMCRNHNRDWNKNCARMGELEKFSQGAQEPFIEKALTVKVNKKEAFARNKRFLVEELKKHLDELSEKQAITGYVNNEEKIEFSYKNEQIRKCLLKAGNVLELVTYMCAMNAKNKKGNKIYCDALCGVVIDWDGEIHTGRESVRDTENEIDGLFVKGMVPVFVSCKNGDVDEDELYKLDCVANKFGIKYAKKILVVTDLQKNYNATLRFRNRARKMGIMVVDSVHKMTPAQISKRLSV